MFRVALAVPVVGLWSAPLSAEAFDDYRSMQGARCSFTVSIDARQVGQGGYSVDPVSGSIGLTTIPPLSR